MARATAAAAASGGEEREQKEDQSDATTDSIWRAGVGMIMPRSLQKKRFGVLLEGGRHGTRTRVAQTSESEERMNTLIMRNVSSTL